MSIRAVILNIAQARLFAASGQGVDDVLSFCPTATYFLKEQGHRVHSTHEIYDAAAHGEVVALVAREQKLLADAAVLQYGLGEAEADGLGVYLYHYLRCVYHLHFCLRGLKNDSLYWVDAGVVKHGDYAAMFASLATQPSAVIMAYSYTHYSLAHFLLAECYNRIIFLLSACSNRFKVMDYGDELSKRIIHAMENPLVFNTHTVGKNAYKTTRFFIKSLARLASGGTRPVYVFRAARPSKYRAVVASFNVPVLHAPEVQGLLKTMVERFDAYLVVNETPAP